MHGRLVPQRPQRRSRREVPAKPYSIIRTMFTSFFSLQPNRNWFDNRLVRSDQLKIEVSD